MTTDFSKFVRRCSDFPMPGIVYQDFSPLLEDPLAFRSAIDLFASACASSGAERLAAIEAKGFIIGGALAARLSMPLSLIRKPGLTPGAPESVKFEKEYGYGEYTLQKGAIRSGEKVAIIYDILAGPGASLAAAGLVKEQGGEAVAYCFVTEILKLGGREKLGGCNVTALVQV